MQSGTFTTEYLQRERKDPFCFDFNGGIALKMFKEMDFEENSLWSKFGKMVWKGFTRGSLFCEILVFFFQKCIYKKGFQPMIFEVNPSPCNSEKLHRLSLILRLYLRCWTSLMPLPICNCIRNFYQTQILLLSEVWWNCFLLTIFEKFRDIFFYCIYTCGNWISVTALPTSIRNWSTAH